MGRVPPWCVGPQGPVMSGYVRHGFRCGVGVGSGGGTEPATSIGGSAVASR